MLVGGRIEHHCGGYLAAGTAVPAPRGMVISLPRRQLTSQTTRDACARFLNTTPPKILFRLWFVSPDGAGDRDRDRFSDFGRFHFLRGGVHSLFKRLRHDWRNIDGIRAWRLHCCSTSSTMDGIDSGVQGAFSGKFTVGSDDRLTYRAFYCENSDL